MPTTLKQKTIKGLFWSAVDSVAGTGLNFVVLIILARLLSPEEFGLLGLTVIFITIGQVMVDGGLSYALIRKQDCTQAEYSTVFYFNVGLSVLLYLLLYATAPAIAGFFNQPALTAVLRVIGLYFVIGSTSSIQQTILTKRIDFRSQAFISLIAAISSGTIAIYMAYTGWGIWALVGRTLLNQTFRSAMLWIHNKWLPAPAFDLKSFGKLFHFGYKLMLIYLISGLFRNIYNAVIGKFYSLREVGYYNTADQYANAFGMVIGTVTTKVTLPVFSRLQDDKAGMKRAAAQSLEGVMFITFLGMGAIIVVARPLILCLLGGQWEPSAIYLQVLCLAYMSTPMQGVNQNIMNALGRSGLFLKTEIIKYLLFIPVIIAGILWGLPILMGGFILFSWTGYIINAWYSKQLIGYSIPEQIKQQLPAAGISLAAGTGAYLSLYFLFTGWPYFLQIAATLSIFLMISLLFCSIFVPAPYKEALIIIKRKCLTK